MIKVLARRKQGCHSVLIAHIQIWTRICWMEYEERYNPHKDLGMGRFNMLTSVGLSYPFGIIYFTYYCFISPPNQSLSLVLYLTDGHMNWPLATLSSHPKILIVPRLLTMAASATQPCTLCSAMASGEQRLRAALCPDHRHALLI